MSEQPCLNPDYCGTADVESLCANCDELAKWPCPHSRFNDGCLNCALRERADLQEMVGLLRQLHGDMRNRYQLRAAAPSAVGAPPPAPSGLVQQLQRLQRYRWCNGAPWFERLEASETAAEHAEYGGLVVKLSAIQRVIREALRQPAAQASGPHSVYVVESGCYDQSGIEGVYDTLEAAMAAHPIPTNTNRQMREGGWQASTVPDTWSNGYDWEDHKEIHRYEVQEGPLFESLPFRIMKEGTITITPEGTAIVRDFVVEGSFQEFVREVARRLGLAYQEWSAPQAPKGLLPDTLQKA